MDSAPTHRLGVAGGILNMSRTLGMGLGITLGGLSYQLFLSMSGTANENTAPRTHLIFAFRYSFTVLAFIAAIALAVSFIRQRSH